MSARERGKRKGAAHADDWLECRAGWRETSILEHTGPQGGLWRWYMGVSIDESPMSWLASQPHECWQQFLARLTPQEKMALPYQWRGWKARPNQLAPEGSWRVWLILSGR